MAFSVIHGANTGYREEVWK